MTTTPHAIAVLRLRSALLASVIVASAVLIGGIDGAPAAADGHSSVAGPFQEVGRVALDNGADGPFDLTDSDVARSGWLILNPLSRRGYQVFEGSGVGTVIQSFDLDTFAPLRRVTFPNVYPLTSGVSDAGNPGTTLFAGEIVHAVDEEAGKLYLALGQESGLPTGIINPDAQRQFLRVVAIDEAAFGAGQAQFSTSFVAPPTQARLQAHFLLGLKVTRYGAAATRTSDGRVVPGKLLAVLGSPTVPAFVPVTNTPLPSPFDHELVQWDVSDLGPLADFGQSPLPLKEEGASAHTLRSCATAPLSSGGPGNYQWQVLASPDAVYLGCQTAPGAGGIVRVLMAPIPGQPGRRGPVGEEAFFPLSQQIADILVDDGGRRLLLRGWINNSTAAGQTWWVFDAVRHRYTGSIAALQYTGFILSAGLEPSTGRLYSLVPDHYTQNGRGGWVPVRGGFQISDTRLDPVPPLDNVRPDLAYNGIHAIRFDRVTRRVFVRRGHGAHAVMPIYPDTDATRPARTESFYRVLEDRVPVPTQQPDADDGAFTTDVEEAAGVTTASYLGSGAGYGSRVVLTGGLRALTNGNDLRSACSRDDREIVVGAIGSVSVSDLSLSAEAAAMDADARTREVFGDPLNRCKPQSGVADADRCSLPADSEELAFDERISPPRDENGDGCPDRTGVNRYAAGCVGDGTGTSPGVRRVVPRSGFTAEVTCVVDDEKAFANSTGSMSAKDLLPSLGATPLADVRLSYSNSRVEIDRDLGKGITVRVDSIARNIEIPGVGTIGVVRTEASSTATGRRSRGNRYGARTTFTRTICGVRLPAFTAEGCLTAEKQKDMIGHLNRALGNRGRARLRAPDDVLAAGSKSGYGSGIQREADDLFADRVIERDASLVVPGLELTFFHGDGGDIGTARQIFHFAGVQATTTYGIACLYGAEGDGCASAPADSRDPSGDASSGATDTVTSVDGGTPGTPASGASGKRESLFERILKAPYRMLEDVMRLLFNNPRELGLVAAVWALLYAPCYLGERRRSIVDLRARRTAFGESA